MTALPTFLAISSVVAGSADILPSTNLSGVIPGDLLLLVAQTSAESVTTPSGWTAITPQTAGTPATAGAVGLYPFYRRATDATCATGATVTVADSGNHQIAQVLAFRGVSEVGTNPWDVLIGGTEANNDTSLSATGGTTTVDNCLVVALMAHSVDTTTYPVFSSVTNSDLGSLTSRADVSTASGTGGGYAVYTGTKATAGSFGATTATASGNSNFAFITIALAPAEHPYIVGIGSIASSTTTPSPAWPSGHQADDIGLLFVETCGGEAVGALSGWTALTNSPQATGSGTDGTQLTVYYKRATGSSETAPTITDAGDHTSGVIHVIRNCITTGSPVNVDGGGVKSSASTTVTITGVTTTVSDCLVLAVTTRDNDSALAEFSNWSNGTLTNPTEVYDAGGTGGNGGGFGMLRGVLGTAGATGSTTADSTNSVVNAFMTIALKSATSSGGGGGGARSFGSIIG